MNPVEVVFVGAYKSAVHMLPFFLASVLIASIINSFDVAKLRVHVFLNKHPLKMILLASLLGTLSPFCSCGVIPIIAGLLTAGAPISPVLAFWISSPLMDPDTFIITLGGLGLKMAIFRLVAAFLMGVMAGLVGLMFKREDSLKPEILNPAPVACGCSGKKSEKNRLEIFANSFLKMTAYLGKWLILAFILEALIINYLPMNWIEPLLGNDSRFGILLSSIIGLPLYVNGISAIPIVKGLMVNGMSVGSAMAFLISGPVTTVPAMIAVTSIARRKLFLAYLMISLFGAIIFGYLCQMILG